MHLRWKIGICLSFLTLEFLGCYVPPVSRPTPAVRPRESAGMPVKPQKKEEPYIVSQLDSYSVRNWRYIVIHHSASASGSAAQFDKYHREKRRWENGLGYHFVIGNGNGAPDGKIEIGNRWISQIDGAHAGVQEYNHYGIGICLVGNFNESYPTAAQMASLSAW
ncbi:MAG: N-acetylmuramoyl-L-alanine amidase [Candidatus Brocadia fulgida]|uniref:N-acetylmuramoyl-L-alanine amidase n=1 Tax=Candidatus Brocadia fulgida TaxID=380242 RepID=A0A0M2UQA9_9BACT|nr:MAG: N-acetylmuramoyl-L-alanine amidase [Candidatus Brocadia fulgida]